MGTSSSVQPNDNKDLTSGNQQKPEDTKSSPAANNTDSPVISAKDAKLVSTQGTASKASGPKAAEVSSVKVPPSPEKQVSSLKAVQGNTAKVPDPKSAEVSSLKVPPSSEKQVSSVKATQGNTAKVPDPKAAEASQSKVPPSSEKPESPSKLPSLAATKDKTENDSASIDGTETDALQGILDEKKKGLKKPSPLFSRFNRFWTSVKNFKGSVASRTTSSVSANHLDKVESDSRLSNDSRVESSIFLNQQKLEEIFNAYKKTLSVLLVFPTAGKQYKVFCEAIKRTNFFQASQATDSKSAITFCKEYIFDLIIIDATNKDLLDAKDLCRKLRVHNPRTVFVAVRSRTYIPWKPNSERLLSYLAAGFTRDFLENESVVACQDALLYFEKDVQLMMQLRFLKSLFSAVENCQEAIEISNANHELQFVNQSYERVLGYSMEEVIGKPWYDLLMSERNPIDQPMKIKQQLDSSNLWEGNNYIRKKSGEQVSNACRIIPLIEAGKVLQFIGIRRVMDSKLNEPKLLDSPSSSNQSGWPAIADAHAAGSRRISAGGIRERMMSLTATQSPHSVFSNVNLVNDITAALATIKSYQCPQTVYQIIDRVTDMLRMNDRSNRVASVFKEDDELVTELMDGLMTASIPTNAEDDARGRRRSTYYALSKSVSRMTTRSSEAGSIPISALPLAGTIQSSAGEIRRVLENVFNWNFNVLRLEELTNKRPLLYVGLKIFQTYEVYSFLNTDAATFKNWFDVIEHHYNAHNPYHNSTHAADVLQAAAALCRREKLMEIFDDMDIVSTLIAAAIHDLDHPGKTNSFLINSSHKLAILYNDVSVLENHHTALAFRLTFKDSTVNIFQKVEKDDYKVLRQQIIDMVLATDMTKHFDYLNRFNDIKRLPPVDGGLISPGMRMYPVEVRTVVKRMLIKCCDVSNPTRPLESCKIWAYRIAEEYCRQTDEEKARGLQVVMPVFDRTKCNLPKTQLSFMNLFIVSMMESWNEFCPVPDLMRNLETNFDYWQQLEPSTKEKVVRVVTN